MSALTASMESPVGPLTLWEEDGAITALSWDRAGGAPQTPLLQRAIQQLEDYFAHKRESFDLPLNPKGDAFQQRFLKALSAIPYGETRTYGDMAKDLDTMPQAIGQACGSNSIAIIIPCHRVLASNGLGGFSGRGGIEAKVALLKHEGAASLLI